MSCAIASQWLRSNLTTNMGVTSVTTARAVPPYFIRLDALYGQLTFPSRFHLQRSHGCSGARRAKRGSLRSRLRCALCAPLVPFHGSGWTPPNLPIRGGTPQGAALRSAGGVCCSHPPNATGCWDTLPCARAQRCRSVPPVLRQSAGADVPTELRAERTRPPTW